MKLRNLFMAVVAGAAMLVGCNKEVDLGPAKLALDQTTLAFEAAGGSQTLNVTATRDWAVSGVPEWVALSATSGKAAVEAQPVKITVAQNTEYNRSATIVFTIGFARASLTIEQAGPEGEIDNGDGTLDNPYNVAGVIEYLDELGADVVSPKKVFVAGIVSAVDEAYTTQYGNGSFKISDDGTTAGAQFTAYRVLYLGNKKFTASDVQVEVGDEVIIYGNVVNYKGNTPETNQNSAFLYSLNGVDKGGAEGGGETGEPKGTGTAADPFNVAAAINAVKDLTWTSTTEYDKVGPYYVKGIVKSISEAYSTQYGNGTFYIKDADTDNEFYVFRALYLNNKKFASGDTALAEGDEVIIYGELMNYRGNTPETVQNSCYLYSLNGNTGGGSPATPSEPKGSGTVADPYNPAGANAFISTLAADVESENDIYVKGIISSIKDQYVANDYGNGSFYITEDGKSESESFYCFRVLYLNNQKFTAGDTPVKVGDEVVICGKVVNYKGNTPETAGNKAYLYSLVPGEGGDDPVEPGEDIEGYTIQLTNENTWTAGSDATYGAGFETVVEGIKIGVYKHASTTAIITPDQYSARVYKGAVISITAPEGVNMTAIQFLASDYSSGQYCKDLTVLEGGSGTIPANTTTYKVGPWTGSANKVVFHSPAAQSRLVSVTIAFDGEFNPGGGDQPGGGDEPGGNDGLTPETAFTASEAIAKATEAGTSGTTDKFYVKGIITGNVDINAQYHNATFDIVDGLGASAVFNIFRLKSFDGANFETTDPLAAGDEVIVYGKLKIYSDKPEMDANGTLIQWNGKTSFDNEPGGGDEPGGNDGLTPETAFTASEAIAKATEAGTSGTTDKFYVKGIITGNVDINAQYHNATFDIVDGLGASAVFNIFRLKSFDGANFETTDPLAAGDEVIVYGKLKVYNNKPEMDANGTLIKWNGKTSFDNEPGGGDQPGGGDEPGGGDQPGGGDGNNVSFDTSQLAAAADNGATVAMNDVISFTNSSNYNGTAVTELRIYKSQTFTVSAASGYVVTKIEFTCTASGTTKQGPGCWGAGAPAGYSYNDKDGVWEGSSNSVAFTATDNQVRIVSLKVTYAAQ